MMLSAINEPLADAVTHTPGNTQGRASPKETKRPSSPVALSIEGPERTEQHTRSPDSPNQQPAAGDATNASFGSTASPIASESAHPDATFHIPPDLDFLLSNPSPFALSLDGLGPFVPGFPAVIDGSGPGSVPTEQIPPAFTHTYSFLPQQTPLQGQPMFGLGPSGSGYSLNESISMLSPISQVGTQHDARAHHHFGGMGIPSGSGRADGGVPDFALMDDGQGFPPSFLSAVRRVTLVFSGDPFLC